jgi:hypothetical protein
MKYVSDTGHFAMDPAEDEIAALIRSFIGASREKLHARRPLAGYGAACMTSFFS